jgi:multidrug transporter EmrE-like cation transporter
MRVPGWLLFLLALVAFELIADIFAKQFAISGKLTLAFYSMLGFIAANAAWIISLRTGAQLSRGAVLFSVLSAIGAAAIGLLVYHEHTSRYQVLGLGAGIIAIVLLLSD